MRLNSSRAFELCRAVLCKRLCSKCGSRLPPITDFIGSLNGATVVAELQWLLLRLPIPADAPCE